MNYLYHMVPDEMIGNVLFPLNELKTRYPQAYKKEVVRYEGREVLFKVKLPYLDCGLGDVLHLMAVPPKIMNAALRKAGFSPKKIKWFKIDPYSLDKTKAVVYLYKNRPAETRYDSDNFARFVPDNISKFSKLSKNVLDYYQSEFDGKRSMPRFRFNFIPHILYNGSISIKEVEVVEA